MQSPSSIYRSRIWNLRTVALLFAVPALLLAWHIGNYALYAARSVAYRHGLDFGEGIVWQQMLLMPGPRMYGDIHTYPYVVFHYTPLYHAIVRMVGALGADILATGRLISVLCTFGASALVVVAARRMLLDEKTPSTPAWMIATLSGLLLFSFRPLWSWSVLLRSDMLALLLTLAGFVLMLHAFRREWLAHVAMVLFVLGVYSKQTFVAAPAATLLVWLLCDYRVALRLGMTGAVLGGALLVWLSWLTSGGFILHVILYNVNPFGLRLMLYHFWTQKIFVLYAMLAIAALMLLLHRGWTNYGLRGWANIRARLRDDPRAYRLALVALYLPASALMLITMGKEGAGPNYLMEWFAIACVALAPLFAWSVSSITTGSARTTGIAILALLTVQLTIAPSTYDANPDANRAKVVELDELVDMARKASSPVLSDNMVVLMRAGKEVPLESAIFHALSIKGVWDQRPFVAMLARGDFAFIISDGDDDSNLYRGRYTEEMREAIRAAYPVRRRMAGHVVHLPKP